MRSKPSLVVLIVLTGLVLAGCTRTHISTSSGSADIYMDDQYIGTGEADIASVGPPHTARLEAREGDAVVGKSTLSRRFHWKTVILGIFSYYTGLYWGWYYPPYHVIPVREYTPASSSKKSNWGSMDNSRWMQPLNPPESEKN